MLTLLLVSPPPPKTKLSYKFSYSDYSENIIDRHQAVNLSWKYIRQCQLHMKKIYFNYLHFS